MPDTIGDGREKRGQAHRILVRKDEALKDAERFRERQNGDLRDLIKERDKAREGDHEDRLKLLNHRIDAKQHAIQQTTKTIKDLKKFRLRLRERIRWLTHWIKRRKRQQKNEVVASPGSPHWGGGADIFKNEVIPAAGVSPHSTKRTETYGNPGSDHHVSQVYAYAGDFPASLSLAIRIARALGIGYYGYAQDYQLFYIVRNGHTYRVQIIAANHGTGPHVHCGMELV